MDDEDYDRQLRFFCAAPGVGWDYWRFIVEYPDYEWVDGMCVADSSQALGDCLTPPVLPHPCYWEGP